MPHIQCRQTIIPIKDGTDRWSGKDGGKKEGREEIHCMDHDEKS